MNTGKARILIVDDEAVNVRMLERALGGDYLIDTACGGHEAISRVKQKTPDLILLDIMMPDLDGFEVCTVIKSSAKLAHIPVIFLTALDSAESEIRGFEAGGIDYITKPVHTELLRLRVRNHLELVRSRNNFNLFFNLVPDLVCIAGPDGYFKDLNGAWESVLGFSRNELLSKPFLEFVHPDDVQKTIAKLEHQRFGQTVIGFTNRYRCADGTYIWLEWMSTPSEEMGTIYAVARNITDHILLEARLQDSLDEARATNSTMNRLLRVVAHEFRTPLGLLTGSTDIIDRYRERLTDDQRGEQYERIRSAVQQLNGLISSVISYNDHKTEDAVLNQPQCVDIAEFCTTVAAEVASVWGAGHTFHAETDGCGSAEIPILLLRQVLENLLTNSFRYTPADGTVSLRVSRQQHRLLMEVSDSGIGIPHDDQQKIFEAFFRSRNVAGRRGLGLGLSIVRDALQQLGGAITITSTVGSGTSVQVEIPVTEPAGASACMPF